VGVVGTPDAQGYWLAAADGGVFAYGNAHFFGSMGGQHLNAPVVGIAATPSGGGYWLAAADGGVFAFGDAQFFGSMAGQQLNRPVVGVASTPDGNGYWLAAADGGVFAFGDAGFYGSMGGQQLNQPVAGIAATPDGKGYWLAAADGGVFAYGSAGFYGSMAGRPLNQPVVAVAGTADGKGYWLTAADGGVFAFGDAAYVGGMANILLSYPVSSITRSMGNDGYWLVAQDGGVFSFGNAEFYGSHGGQGVATDSRLWGVDSLASSSSLLSSVVSKLGQPDFYGRYINYSRPSGNITSAEAASLHSKSIKVLIVSSPARSNLTTAGAADADADAAISSARSLGIPAGVALFRDVEANYAINQSYISEYYSYFARSGSGYVPGFYENAYPSSSGFTSAYCAGVSATPGLSDGVVLFASEPSYRGVSPTKSARPDFSPKAPSCANRTVAWQYELPSGFPAAPGGWPDVDVDQYSGPMSYLW
jgi:hypothetical protein